MLSELYRDKKGKALGIRSGFGSLSGLAPMGLPVLAFMIGWRNIFLFYSVVALAIGYLFYVFVEETLDELKKRSGLTQLKMGLRSLTEKRDFFHVPHKSDRFICMDRDAFLVPNIYTEKQRLQSGDSRNTFLYNIIRSNNFKTDLRALFR